VCQLPPKLLLWNAVEEEIQWGTGQHKMTWKKDVIRWSKNTHSSFPLTAKNYQINTKLAIPWAGNPATRFGCASVGATGMPE